MDKRKYLTKTLIAEFDSNDKNEKFRFREIAYRLKDNTILMEYEGGGLTIYGVKTGFNKYIARKGIYNIDESDFEMWKRIRSDEKQGSFIDWELEKQMQFDEIQDEIFKMQCFEHDNILKLVGNDDLPF